jgi:hypothetical protein
MKIPCSLHSTFLAAALSLTLTTPRLMSSDHADGPTVAGDQAADLADCYMFPDPNDATKLVIINTLRGFIVPGEAVNFALFDSSIRYRFEIENTGDAKGDAFIDVTFSEKNSTGPQTATVVLSGKAFAGIKGPYTGTTTVAGLGATPPGGANYFPASPQTLTGGPSTDIAFFAGESDDPFFFDIPAFSRFRASALAHFDPANQPNPPPLDLTTLDRGRDTFAGYNVMVIAFRLPISALKSTRPGVTNTTKFGLDVLAQRQTESTNKGRKHGSGAFKTVDREGNPAVNALLVPIQLKNKFNGATTLDDADGDFAAAIVGTLTSLGTSQANIDLLASIAVTKGDFLRIDLTQPIAFPNGRNPADDVVKTLLSVVAGTTIDDNVAANDVAFSANFPYLGLPQQPRNPNADPVLNVDDNTRN